MANEYDFPQHIAYQVAQGMPVLEALCQAVTEALEGTGQELEALEWMRCLAELTHPDLRITTLIGPVVPAFSDLA